MNTKLIPNKLVLIKTKQKGKSNKIRIVQKNIKINKRLNKRLNKNNK